MVFTHALADGALVLKIKGDLLGLNNESQILSVVEEQIEAEVLNCAIDISELNYINSSGLTIFIKILTKFRNKGGEVVLVNPSQQVDKLLVITKLNSIFKIVQSEKEALESF